MTKDEFMGLRIGSRVKANLNAKSRSVTYVYDDPSGARIVSLSAIQGCTKSITNLDYGAPDHYVNWRLVSVASDGGAVVRRSVVKIQDAQRFAKRPKEFGPGDRIARCVRCGEPLNATKGLAGIIVAQGVVHEKCASRAEIDKYMNQPGELKGVHGVREYMRAKDGLLTNSLALFGLYAIWKALSAPSRFDMPAGSGYKAAMELKGQGWDRSKK